MNRHPLTESDRRLSFGPAAARLAPLLCLLLLTPPRSALAQPIYAYDPAGNLTNVSSASSGLPSILSQPGNALLSQKGSAIFSVVASGPGPIFYQWLVNGAPLAGATSDTLVLPNTPVPLNLLSNGGFEQPVITSASVLYSSNQTLGSWTVESNSVYSVLTVWQPAEGYQSLDLNGSAPGAIYQDVATVPGQAYTLSFALAGDPRGLPTIKTNQVWWNGSLLDTPTFNTTGHTTANMGWTNLQYSVTATSTNTRIRFASLITTVYGPVLDNVSLSFAQPAPPLCSVVLSNASGSITSTVATVNFDFNNNGIPDWWEMEYFRGYQPASGDFDGDGVNNLNEFLEGTNPTNRLSFNPRLNVQATRGRVFASPDLAYYTNGQAVTLTALPDTGDQFLGWSGAVTGSLSPQAITMNTNLTVVASFGLPLPVAVDCPNPVWTTTGNALWFGQAEISYDGVGAAQSGLVGDGQSSSLQAVTNLSQPMQVSFWWMVSSQPGDALNFYVDGGLRSTISGTGAGWQRFQTSLTAASHTLLWVYAKGGGDLPTGAPVVDAGWLDQVVFGFPPQITNQPASQVILQGSTATLNVGVSGTPAFTYQWSMDGSPTATTTTPSLVLSNVQPPSAGSYQVVITNAFGAATSSVAFLTVTTTNCSPPPSGLVAWWPADGYAIDVVAANNGTLQHGASYAPGLVGQAFSFNGASNYVQLPDNLFPFPTSGAGTTPFSFALWFQTTSNGVILGQQTTLPYTNPPNYVPPIYVGADGKLRAEMFWKGTTAPLTTSGIVNDGNFHHLALVFDGATETMYLDGLSNAASAFTQSGYAANYHYQLGVGYTSGWPSANGTWYPFNGLIDEPALWNRALAPSEVLGMYQAGGAGMCRPVASLASVTPGTGVLGAAITLDGSNLDSVTNVQFNGVSASFTILSNTRLIASIPTNASTGPVTLLTILGPVSSAASFTVLTSPFCVFPPPGLVDWWPAEGNANDALGAHNGTVLGATNFASGKVGQAFSFNGTNAYVDFGSNWFTLQSFTVCFWVKPAATQPNTADLLDNNHSTSANWGLEDEGTGLTFDWDEYWGPGELGLGRLSLNPNVWQHVAITVDSNYLNQVYLNGAVVSSFQGHPIYYDGTQYLRLARWGGGGRFFNGLIDELAIFNRGLSPAEVASIYVADSAGFCLSTPPIAFDTSPGALAWTPNGLQMRVTGLTAHGPVIIFASTNLSAWVPIYTNPPVTGSLPFMDTSATNSKARFYRALQQ